MHSFGSTSMSLPHAATWDARVELHPMAMPQAACQAQHKAERHIIASQLIICDWKPGLEAMGWSRAGPSPVSRSNYNRSRAGASHQVHRVNL